MSSLQRSRSLRKPTATNSTSTVQGRDVQPERRKISPSRLPVKPPSYTTASTTAASNASKTSRPPSAGLGRSASLKSSSVTAQEPPKREPSRYPPLSSSNRPPVTTRPTSSSGAASQTKRGSSHTRSKSNVTTLNSATVLRPPSRDQPRSTATAPTRSSHSRSASVDKAATAAPPAPAPVAAKTRSTTNSTQAQPRLRPAFSTLQQHYSPAKSHAPKPLTSAIIAPPSPSKLPANVAASVETSKLQAELLQLHILHRDAEAVHAQWRLSAKEKLGQRFRDVSEQSSDVAERERSVLESRNVLALRSWGIGGGLEEKIQNLEGIVAGLWTLSEPGGRYARVVRRFERWIDSVCEMEQARSSEGVSRLLKDHESFFIGDLNAPWKDECPGIVRRLEAWQRQLGAIDNLPAQGGTELSSLQRMLESSRSLVGDMLVELATMGEIEQDALAREEAWIEKVNRYDDDDDDDRDTPRAGAIWRAL